LIDESSGDARPITPEGVAGVHVSPDGRSTAVLTQDGKWGVWPLEGSAIRPIPGLDSRYNVIGWSPDGGSVQVIAARASEKSAKVYRVSTATGRMELWRTFGAELGSVGDEVRGLLFSADGKAYAYVYTRIRSQAYVVTGLK
jgi:WD40 repeat protein